jgi:hypothetical protein
MLSASNQMFTGMPTENKDIFRAAGSGEYVYVSYSGRQINEEQILVSTSLSTVWKQWQQSTCV